MTRNILVKPIVSEKSERDISKLNRYTFIVDKKANKLEIKKAVETMFGTTVVEVNTSISPAKLKSRNTKSGVVKGRISAYKKAFVTLAEGEELDIYGKVEE
ncbi:MAG TPA: 50S ribosomal protein L23 [Saprospiraceae bacterium]|jgi:large subunit ribosomal protein L23|nr:50S ribosomal protein L23 [Saprospiraceae bacterium]HRO08319.1 50S ribosomal protein L23 [Saprospiraceae bacterium]HRP41732.1 50S ribosomal protein L23 [Saprospiraceae bacterium]